MLGYHASSTSVKCGGSHSTDAASYIASENFSPPILYPAPSSSLSVRGRSSSLSRFLTPTTCRYPASISSRIPHRYPRMRRIVLGEMSSCRKRLMLCCGTLGYQPAKISSSSTVPLPSWSSLRSMSCEPSPQMAVSSFVLREPLPLTSSFSKPSLMRRKCSSGSSVTSSLTFHLVRSAGARPCTLYLTADLGFRVRLDFSMTLGPETSTSWSHSVSYWISLPRARVVVTQRPWRFPWSKLPTSTSPLS
mmetsp:Transcript_39627/g.122522  ORF Transcript_39627/g.122522 Transcript_39627/m.122522 type:complete len:248 (-) Transcript_39627:659-1402(-)